MFPPLARGGLGWGMVRSDSVQLFNDAHYKSRRQTLRKNSTYPEQLFWQVVRDRQLGFKFRRQQGIGHYIADFYCADCQLVVELDGDSHFTHEAKQYDHLRDEFFNSCGLKVLRFTNKQIVEDLSAVIEYLRRFMH